MLRTSSHFGVGFAALLPLLGCRAPASPALPTAAEAASAPHPNPAALQAQAPEPPAPAPAPAPAAPKPSASAPPPTSTGTSAVLTAAKDPLLEQLLQSGGATLKSVVAKAEEHRFQLLYGIVHEGATPSLERRGYRVDAEYFFPASSMKMPIVLAMFDRMSGVGLGRDTTITLEPTTGAYVTSVSRETWRALIVSDNFSANRLLGIVGHRELHETLWSLGIAGARVRTGFATGAEIDPAEVSPKIEIATGSGPPRIIAARRSDLTLPPTNATGLDIGKATVIDGRREEHPMSFSDKNAIPLRELQDTLVRIMRPELLAPGSPPDTASSDDLAYVRQALGTLPSESGLAGFQRNVVADYQLIPFLRGIERVRPRGAFKIYSKVGQAFGFLIANAYVVDVETKRSFFLTAAIYANPDEVMNDDVYAYDTIAFPALADVGETVARHALGGT
jgi:hypothetical protein